MRFAERNWWIIHYQTLYIVDIAVGDHIYRTSLADISNIVFIAVSIDCFIIFVLLMIPWLVSSTIEWTVIVFTVIQMSGMFLIILNGLLVTMQACSFAVRRTGFIFIQSYAS